MFKNYLDSLHTTNIVCLISLFIKKYNHISVSKELQTDLYLYMYMRVFEYCTFFLKKIPDFDS